MNNPLQEMVFKAVRASGRKVPTFCVVCRGVAKYFGAWLLMSEEDRAHTLTTGRLRVVIYSACKQCSRRSNFQVKLAENIMTAPNAWEIEVPIAHEAFKLLD